MVIPGVNEAIDKRDHRPDEAANGDRWRRRWSVPPRRWKATDSRRRDDASRTILKTLLAAAGATFLSLFPIVNPFGGVPLFFSMTSKEFQDRRANRPKTAMYVFAILVCLHVLRTLCAQLLRNFTARAEDCRRADRGQHGMEHGDGTTRITAAESEEAATKNDISLTPMAMPMLSGPGSIGVVMGLAAHVENAAAYAGMVIGIGGIALSVALFFCMGGPLVRRLGPSAVGAINKIFGFLILAIAVQLVWNGIADFKN